MRQDAAAERVVSCHDSRDLKTLGIVFCWVCRLVGPGELRAAGPPSVVRCPLGAEQIGLSYCRLRRSRTKWFFADQLPVPHRTYVRYFACAVLGLL
ncbi:hypothetical protein CH063_04276 [Colletotrichum higginsianum]|uniref:Uncharacterized protein n=1 Tax=Colletotrichum higginsianum (strain IMI 349063) TaxID=759273 RepID=H1W5L3_COLHI|nr:hypothetical protein CH063_04276 [Colletotrichum higginsianum]